MVDDYPDDPGIADSAQLWRWVRPDAVVRDQKRPSGWRLSSQAFQDSSDGTPCSVALRDETWTLEEVERKFPGYGIAQIAAGQARALQQRVLRWADPDLPGHAYIAGPKSKATRRDLAAAAVWVAGATRWD